MSQIISTKQAAFIAVMLLVFASFFYSCSSGPEYVEETVSSPTEGLITTVKEVEADLFKIEDEQVVPSPADSRIIANYMDGTRDTLTLQEAQLVDANDQSGTRRRGGIFRAASYGLMGYMMGRSMSSRPSAGAYVDQKTYNRVNNGAGNRIQNSAKRTTVRKPAAGKSGFGGGKSTRSVGG